ncbi:glycerol-3-phosphate dehydrogenase [NAD(P)+] [Waddlia chondrophila 2032/99]|nr:glycerol-3-phosphate dehydrogenase [NAD(P)+] [Waddlia chondrophila 2032/99]
MSEQHQMKIGYLGAGAWGFALASLLASKKYEVVSWTISEELADRLNRSEEHPMLPGSKKFPNQRLTTDLQDAVQGADLIVESVTSAGIRPVFEQLKKVELPSCPIVITSKGIEQDTGLILSDVISEVLGEGVRCRIGAISGPSYAAEVVKGQPTSVTGSAYDPAVMETVCKAFNTEAFRVYPNHDMRGVALGGALKNVIAIACGVAEGLNLGYSARAALMTRGLHEIRKLAVSMGANSETLYGLSGMGDLTVTCSAMTSRNFKFGYLLSQGKGVKDAKKEIGMAVEGAYTCVSALQLSKKLNVPMPISECVYQVVFEGLPPKEAVVQLMKREIKQEHL